MKVYIYIDGFNLYYRAVKGTRYKWLNLARLCQIMVPRDDIVKIKYFTARISSRPDDPDQPNRQLIYLRALRTIPYLEIVFGSFLQSKPHMPLASDPTTFVQVIKTEEKGSDVNIATHLVSDGYKEKYEVSVLLTNDSDLAEAIRIVRHDLNLPVGVLSPGKNTSQVLVRDASFVKSIRTSALKRSQFPSQLKDDRGVFTKPKQW
jgi:uncharacterized LabA/DUF88 family protein